MSEEQSASGGEKFISKMFGDLPRKTADFSGKERIWQKVHSFIMLEKTRSKQERVMPIWEYLLLPRTLIRVGSTVMVVILALTMVGQVANAKPGETLYQVKIAAEQVEKAVAVSDQAKVKVGIKHAKRRLAEVQILVEEKKDPKIVEETLQKLKTTTAELAQQESNTEGDLKAEVKEVISSAQESINRLATGEGEEVKGTLTMEEDKQAGNKTADATSTPKITGTLQKPVTAAKPTKKPDAPIEADVQLGDVFTIDDDNEVEIVE